MKESYKANQRNNFNLRSFKERRKRQTAATSICETSFC